jgi:hypothetical protein
VYVDKGNKRVLRVFGIILRRSGGATADAVTACGAVLLNGTIRGIKSMVSAGKGLRRQGVSVARALVKIVTGVRWQRLLRRVVNGVVVAVTLMDTEHQRVLFGSSD